MGSELTRFSVAMPDDLLSSFDEYVSRRGISTNRSEVIRDLVRDALADEASKDPEAMVAGTITMMYDHHTYDLTRKLDEVQHDYTHEIIATMHVHLDHNNCLETIILKGKARTINAIADKLLGIKGVTQGRLVISALEGYLK